MQEHDSPVAISLRGVTKRFTADGPPAVTDLSLDIPTGQMVAFVGPSGCGKTTTLKMINRLIEPTSGTIEILGRAQGAVPAHELRRNIGYVIQQIGLFPHRTIARNIAVVPELVGWDKRRISARTAELIDLVGLDPDVLDRYPPELSGGQQQRVGVARALAADPPILLMDEPYSAVDPIVRGRLQDELLSLQRQLHKTIVVVTHDIEEALKLGDRVAVFNVGGVLEQYDTPDGLLREPASEFVASFLGRERGLRRLALLTVADVDTHPGVVVGSPDSARAAAKALADQGGEFVTVVDGQQVRGWVPRADLDLATNGSPVSSLPIREFLATVGTATPLREALDVLMRTRSRRAAVVDDDRFVGLVTIDSIAGGLE